MEITENNNWFLRAVKLWTTVLCWVQFTLYSLVLKELYLFRKGANRVLNIYKKEQGTLGWSAGFQLARNSRHQIMALLQRLPLTTRERADLQPRTQKMSISEGLLLIYSILLTQLVPQVPEGHGSVWISLNVVSAKVLTFRSLFHLLFIVHELPDIITSVHTNLLSTNFPTWHYWCVTSEGMCETQE